MLSSVEADRPNAYVHSGAGIGVVDTAPLWPTKITVNNDWARQRDQTIEFWFKQEPLSPNTFCVLSLGINGSNRLIVSVRRGNHTVDPGKIWIQISGLADIYSANRYDDGQWHHCVIVLYNATDRLNQYFYVDSQYESHNYRPSAVDMRNWGTTHIGDCSRFATGYNISGSPLDEIALYNYELPDVRILAHYNEVMAGPPGPSVAIEGQVTISGSLKTNKLVRLDTAQFDVDGFIRALILKDPLPFFIASRVDIYGSLKTALAGRPVATSTRMQSSDIDVIANKWIGIRI